MIKNFCDICHEEISAAPGSYEYGDTLIYEGHSLAVLASVRFAAGATLVDICTKCAKDVLSRALFGKPVRA